MPDHPIHIAIVGGSLGGCSLALGLHLLKRQDITFDVFEAWSFSERGAGVGVHPNGQNSLRELGLDADGLLERAGAFREKAAEAVVAYGEHEGEWLMKLPGGIQCVLRKTLLDEMVKLLPAEKLHSNKKLVTIEEGKERMVLKFEDGSCHETDTVIGFDGLRSTVRGFVLGHSHPAVPPRFTGYWDARAFMPAEETRSRWGEDVIQHDNPREHFRVGDGCTMLFASAPKGHLGGVVVAGAAGPEEMDMLDNAKRPLTREFLEKKFSGWGKPYVDGVIDSLLNPECGPGILFGEYESQDAPTWCRDRMCIMGDAAHAALPWMGQGFSMAAEDAAIMSALLGAVQSREEIADAFRAFDKLRRGPDNRPGFVVKNGAQVASICAGQRGLDPSTATQGLDDMPGLFAHLWHVDMKAEIRTALGLFDELKSRS